MDNTSTTAHGENLSQLPRRAVDSPPRLRAKCVGFDAALHIAPTRAVAGAAGGFVAPKNHAECRILQPTRRKVGNVG